MLDLLKELTAASGVSGDESAVRELICAHAKPYADEIFTDVMGNLIVTKRGERRSEKKVMLCAHMDEVGVIATHITDTGFVKFACVGGIDRRVLAGKRVYFGKDRVAGIIGCRAIHLTPAAERDKVTKVDDMYIDIGASTREAAEKLVVPGDTGAFDDIFREFGDGYVRAKAIDDRIGCAVMLKLLAAQLPIDCTFVFTVQEEVGARGAAIASNRVKPDVALVLEATTAADMPGVAENKRVCSLGGGAVIPFMDGGAIYDRELYNMLTAACDRDGITWQTKQYISGGTDAQVVQRSNSGVQTIAISAPIRNLHSPSCVGKVSDLDAVMAAAQVFLAEMGAQYGA